MLLICALLVGQVPAAQADERSDFILQMARVDLHLRKQEFTEAAQKLGQIQKEFHSDPIFQRYSQRALANLYSAKVHRVGSEVSAQNQVHQRLRVTRRKKDADAGSDQSLDNRGWQVNEHLESDLRLKGDWRGRFVMDVDGFKNGHNDLRYRTVLADVYEGRKHLALGDSSSFPSPYFLRGSRLRGLNLMLDGGVHEFQGVVGAYPFWLEGRDAYIYPRSVWGLRDSVRLFEERFQFSAGVIQTRDNERIRTDDGANPQARVSTANQPRDNVVLSLDQGWKLIPNVWWLKASEAYSWTDENLLQDRFGDNTKLRDPSFTVESLMIQPWVRWNALYQRTGPDFRVLTDLPSGAVSNVKDITSDRQLIEQYLDFNPIGPFDLDVGASWIRNDLDHDSTVAHTRQGWYTANLGILTPRGWPRPRFRGTWIDTVSVPGSTTRPSQVRRLDLRQEISHSIRGTQISGFAEYQTERPQADKDRFDEDEVWSVGTRLARTVLKRILMSPHYKYSHFDEVFNEKRYRGIRHETGLSNSIRLWSTASLGLSYTFLHGKRNSPTGTELVHMEGHAGTATLTWPYSLYNRSRKSKWLISPAVTLHLADYSDKLMRRPLLATRLTTGYEVFRNWKVELMGEFRYDNDKKGDRIRTEESRLWLLWTSEWK